MTTPAAQVAMDHDNPHPALQFAPNTLLPANNYGQVMQTHSHAKGGQYIRLNLINVKVLVADSDAFGSVLLGYLPDKNFVKYGAEFNLTWTKDGTGIVTGENPKVAFGTAAASNSTLSSTMIDIVAGGSGGTSLGTGLTGTVVGHSNDDASPSLTFIDDSATSPIYMNVAVNPTSDGSVIFNGTLDVYLLDTGNVTS